MAVVVLSATKAQVNAYAKDKLLTQKVSDNSVPDFHAFNWRLCKVLIQFKSDYHDNEDNKIFSITRLCMMSRRIMQLYLL